MSKDLALNNDEMDLVLPEELSQQLELAGASIRNACTLSTTKISYKKGGGKWRLPDETYSETFRGVVVAAKHANVHYPNPYGDATNTGGADCVAVRLGLEDVGFNHLVPIPDVEVPYAVACSGCPKLEWKSAQQGAGKACAETMIMAVYIPALGDDLYIVEARRKWSNNASNYLNSATRQFKSPLAVVTEFKLGSDESPWEQNYRAVAINPPELIGNLLSRTDEANSLIDAHVRNALDLRAAATTIVNTPGAGRETRERD
jgi:hypothetical protein